MVANIIGSQKRAEYKLRFRISVDILHLGNILLNDENSYRIVISGGRGDGVVLTGPKSYDEGVWIVWGGSTIS